MVQIILLGGSTKVEVETLRRSGSAALEGLSPTDACACYRPDLSEEEGIQTYYLRQRLSVRDAARDVSSRGVT
jgi:hypothetical protein